MSDITQHHDHPQALDLLATYPGKNGLSLTSLFAMRQLHAVFSPAFEPVPQPAGQMPWGHVRTLLAKGERCFETFVESIFRFALHKRFSGVHRLHKIQRTRWTSSH
jgi:hypothetical protein